MAQPAYILSLDQGTSSCRSILYDRSGKVKGLAQREFTQYYPQPGWVEHDPEEIWKVQLATMREALTNAGIQASEIAGLGITNQRETSVIWNRSSGKASRAIVWQDRRTSASCQRLKELGHEPYIRKHTGLVPDAYFSATKIKWLLDHTDQHTAAANGDILFGNMDTWLIWKLTQGSVHATDPSNASRTMLYDLHERNWSNELASIFEVPVAMLPEVKPSAGFFGSISAEWLGAEIPILGVAGDQQAALYGQNCDRAGLAKNTYGTGCFMLMNTGSLPVSSSSGLLTTVAWETGGEMHYALEGSVFVAGAVIQWLRDGLQIIRHAADSEALAASVPDTGGVYVVPAFAGLGAPWWDMDARGLITGLTRGSTQAHITRAALESIAYQTRDVLAAMQQDSGISLAALRADGGATANDFLMQFQADILQIPVERPAHAELTALGAAKLAAYQLGWNDFGHPDSGMSTLFEPLMKPAEADALYEGWLKAVSKTRTK